MQDIINFIKDQSLMVKIIIFLGVFFIHSIFAVLLNKQNNAKYNKTTGLAWIPVFNVFLLGKLAIHSLVGIILIIGLFFGICVSFNINGLESIHNILPSEYVEYYQIAYGVIIVILCIIVRIKYRRIIKLGLNMDNTNSFVNKDFENKEPEIVANTKPTEEVKEMINDNFKYNHSSSNNDHNNQNPQ